MFNTVIQGIRDSLILRFLLPLLVVIAVGAGVALVVRNPTSSPLAPQTSALAPDAVPKVIGLPESGAETLLESDGYKFTVTVVISTSITGMIVGQQPKAGTHLPLGSTVQLEAATGPALPLVPNVIDVPVAQAEAIVTAAGFRVGQLRQAQAYLTAKGQVMAMSPAPGTRVPANSTITLTVSEGSPPQPRVASTPVVRRTTTPATRPPRPTATTTSKPTTIHKTTTTTAPTPTSTTSAPPTTVASSTSTTS